MRTLTWEGIELGNFILTASIHLWNQFIENCMSSLPLGCDFVTSLLLGYLYLLTGSGDWLVWALLLDHSACRGWQPVNFTDSWLSSWNFSCFVETSLGVMGANYVERGGTPRGGQGAVKVCSINFKPLEESPWMNAIPVQLWLFLVKIRSSWHDLIHNACLNLPKG